MKKSWIRLAIGLSFVVTTTSLAWQESQSKDDAEKPVKMVAEDGKTYSVEPGQTLGDAIDRSVLAQQEPSPPAEPPAEGAEVGNCVPENLEHKPEDAVACNCYEFTHCEGGEARQCKRHCKKDQCTCCSI